MHLMKRLACGAAALAVVAALPAARAATPKDMLVIANQIDDLITLDPAQVFEFSGAEVQAQIYDRLVTYPVDNVENLQGHVAESWEVSEDGLTFTFKIRDGIKFHSGNPLTARDAAFSLQRVIKLNQTPSFILSQFGFTKENVDERIRAVDDRTLVVTLDKPYAPTFFLYVLTAGVGSVVDMKTALENEKDGDLGHEWLKTHSAGSSAFKLRSWKPNESVTLDANPDFWLGAPKLKRVIIRHIAESATQRLLVEKGDVDVARNLLPDDIEALRDNPDINIVSIPKGGIYYLGLSQKNEYLRRPEVRLALKYLLPYQDIVNSVLKGKAFVHQAFLPKGFLGELDETPFRSNLDRAKELLMKAGLENGFKVTMDTRNSSPIKEIAQIIQASFAKAGIELEIIPGDNKQTLTKYRARQHDIYIGRWGPDYQDPNTNADTFASNPDNRDEAKLTGKLAWRNAWGIPGITALTQQAVLERDPKKRAEMYRWLQRFVQWEGPFVIFAQDIEVIAQRANVKGLIWGPSFDDNKYYKAYKE